MKKKKNLFGKEQSNKAYAQYFVGESFGICVYCNHCQPCPARLNVGLINKYYDLSVAGDALARDHYKKLEKKAGQCIKCGHCNSQCPFHADQMARMETIRTYFNE